MGGDSGNWESEEEGLDYQDVQEEGGKESLKK